MTFAGCSVTSFRSSSAGRLRVGRGSSAATCGRAFRSVSGCGSAVVAAAVETLTRDFRDSENLSCRCYDYAEGCDYQHHRFCD